MKSKLFGIGLGIALLFPLVAHMTVHFFKEPPSWDQYNSYGPYEPTNISKAEAAQKNAGAKKERDPLRATNE